MKSPNHGHQRGAGLLPWRMTGQPRSPAPRVRRFGPGKVPVRPQLARGRRYDWPMARTDVRPSTAVSTMEAAPAVSNPEVRLTASHIRGLDGIRAVAVIGVLGFHGGVAGFGGGLLGVDIFFVLSGFLITSLLVAEWSRSGTVSFRRFYERRARRLLPGLFILLLLVAAYAQWFAETDTLEHAAGRRPGDHALRRQLALHLLRAELLRTFRSALAAPAHLVAGGRGAVLCGLARGGPVRPAPGRTAGARRGGGGRHGRLGRPDPGALAPGRQRVAALLRHRHPRPGSDGRSGAGHRGAGHRPQRGGPGGGR